jgi:predicted porin
LRGVDSSEMTSHIFGQNISWIPHSRLSLQVGGNYVVSKTETPTSRHTQAVLDAQNNYWTAHVNSTVVLDNRTDLNLGYFYYASDNYRDNSEFGLPLDAEATEHGVTAAITRRLTENLRLSLRYGYFHYEDIPFGGHNDYEAHVVFTSLQYRF